MVFYQTRGGVSRRVDKNQTSILGSIRKRVKNDRSLVVFTPMGAKLDHFGPFGPFWAICAIFGPVDHYGPFGLFDPKWAIWAILSHLGNFWPCGPS